MALTNAEKQARWRERHAERRQHVAHNAKLLLRRSHSTGDAIETKVGWNTVTFDCISDDVAFGSALRTGARYEGLTTVGAGVVSLQLMKGLTMRRTIAHMNPPAAVPHLTRADT